MNKTAAWILLLVLGLGPGAASAQHFLIGSSIYNNLTRLINRDVHLMLKGGGEISGRVRAVGNNLVHLLGPDGTESLVVADEIVVLTIAR
ncbi:MAG: hypothetical protein D6819_10195 [Gammaproteobacteria bacterium]|nr:MAG: hypothetical protein D6819_10195 [Gammaproteobacteria bacterium]